MSVNIWLRLTYREKKEKERISIQAKKKLSKNDEKPHKSGEIQLFLPKIRRFKKRYHRVTYYTFFSSEQIYFGVSGEQP